MLKNVVVVLILFLAFIGLLSGQSLQPSPIAAGSFSVAGALPAGTADELQTKLTGSTFGGAYANGVGYPISALQTANPSSSITAALSGTGAGNVDNGQHAYVVTFVTALGETAGDTSNTCLVGVTVADKTMNGKVQLSTIPTGPAGVTARKIYRAPATIFQTGFNFACVYVKLLTTIADNSTTTYLDNTADADLGANYIDINTTGFQWKSGSDVIAGYNDFNNENDDEDQPKGFYVVNAFNLVDSTYGHVLDFFPRGAPGGVDIFGNADIGSGSEVFRIEGFMNGTTDLPDGNAVTHFSYLNVSNHWQLGMAMLGVDVDGAASGGKPWIIAVYGAENGSTFSGGYSTAGGFLGVNTLGAPAEHFHVNGTIFTTRPEVGIQRITSQTADMLQLLDTDGTTKLSFFDKDGIPFLKAITTGSATGKKVVCIDTSSGRLWASSTGVDCTD